MSVHAAHSLLSRLRSGSPPNGVLPADCGPFEAWMQQLVDAFKTGGVPAVEQIISSLLEQHGEAFEKIVKPRYTVRWLDETMHALPPIEWLVSKLIAAASLTVVFGKPGSMKTWLVLKMALCVAAGKAFLGRETRQGVTLVIDEESGGRRLSQRLAALARAQNAPHGTPLAFVSLARFDMRQAEDIAEVRRLIEEVGAQFVVIDTLAAATPGVDENAVKEMQPVLASLRKIAEETGAAILVIHHAGKNGDYRGSSAIAGAVDLMLSVKADAENGNVTMQSEKTRDIEPVYMNAHLAFHEDAGGQVDRVFVSPIRGIPEHFSLSTAEQFVLQFLYNRGCATTGEIKASAEDVDGVAPGTAKKAAFDLVAEGNYVRRTDGGGPGIEATFELTAKGHLMMQDAGTGSSTGSSKITRSREVYSDPTP